MATQAAEFIQYTGNATVRQITKAQWARIRVTQVDSTWDKSNRHLLPVSFFSEEALNYLLNQDGNFKRVTEDDLNELD